MREGEGGRERGGREGEERNWCTIMKRFACRDIVIKSSLRKRISVSACRHGIAVFVCDFSPEFRLSCLLHLARTYCQLHVGLILGRSSVQHKGSGAIDVL